MQLIAIAAFIGSALALAQPEGLLLPRQNPAFCSSINSCITTNGDPMYASSFCASFNMQATETTADLSMCTDLPAVKRQAVDVLAPQKPRCLKKFVRQRLSNACSCVVTDATTTVGACPTDA